MRGPERVSKGVQTYFRPVCLEQGRARPHLARGEAGREQQLAPEPGKSGVGEVVHVQGLAEAAGCSGLLTDVLQGDDLLVVIGFIGSEGVVPDPEHGIDAVRVVLFPIGDLGRCLYYVPPLGLEGGAEGGPRVQVGALQMQQHVQDLGLQRGPRVQELRETSLRVRVHPSGDAVAQGARRGLQARRSAHRQRAHDAR